MLDRLLGYIAQAQSAGKDEYPTGLFPVQRTHKYLRYAVEDDTIFPTAVVVYLLQQVKQDLPATSQDLVEKITQKAIARYPAYLNRQGLKMYNFWPNHPRPHFFPNGKLLSRFRRFMLPEDLDTTAYIYLTQPHARQDIAWLRERLILDTNGYRRSIRNTLPPYRAIKTYSSWIAEANMPLDFDVCVLSNWLLFLFSNKEKPNEYDQEAIRFITAVLQNRHHLTHPFEVAPWYADTVTILYHVARLVASTSHPDLLACRDLLIQDLLAQAEKTQSLMPCVLISTSLMRLGHPPLMGGELLGWEEAVEDFYFFIGGLLTSVDHPLTWRLAGHDLFHVRYRCHAHAVALLLEHEVFRQRYA